VLGTVGAPLGGLTIDNAGTGTLTLPSASVDGDIDVITGGSLTFAGAATATGSLLARAAGGDLTIQGVALTAGAAGNALTLSASGNLDVVLPGSALNLTGGGRWLVYSTSPAGSTEGGLALAAGSALPRLYNRTYAANGPGTITEPGNHLIYSTQPTLTVIADPATRAYGAANPAFTFATSGFVTDDGFTDTLANAGMTGALATTAVPASPVTGSPFAITQGTLVSGAGYAINYTGANLAITPAPLTVTADNQSRLVGDPNPPFTASFGGFVLGETLANLAGSLAFATPAVTGSPAGSYAITPSGLTSTNYAITHVDGVMQVTRARTGDAPANEELIIAVDRSKRDDMPTGNPEANFNCALISLNLFDCR
jgi:hypothetical protein